jgi:hypothetical protein
MRITLTLDDDILAKVRSVARKSGKSLKQVVKRSPPRGVYRPSAEGSDSVQG